VLPFTHSGKGRHESEGTSQVLPGLHTQLTCPVDALLP